MDGAGDTFTEQSATTFCDAGRAPYSAVDASIRPLTIA